MGEDAGRGVEEGAAHFERDWNWTRSCIKLELAVQSKTAEKVFSKTFSFEKKMEKFHINKK